MPQNGGAKRFPAVDKPLRSVYTFIKVQRTEVIIKDIKAVITEAVEKITSDEKILESFKKNPIKTVEELTGIDLPDDQLEKVVEGIKAKVTLDEVSGALGGLKNLFKK